MTGDAGVVEDQQPAGVIPGGQPGDVRGQLADRYPGQAAVGIVKQRHGRDTQGRPGLAFALKQAVGTDLIAARERQLWRHVLRRWAGNAGIEVLGSQ